MVRIGEHFAFFLCIAFILVSCSAKKEPAMTDPKTVNTSAEVTTNLSCTLTSAELQKRRETVIAALQKAVVEKKELENGYSFRFTGSDAMIDQLTEFMKTERTCCNFFSFSLHVSDTTTAWLDITGPQGAKDFIQSELGL